MLQPQGPQGHAVVFYENFKINFHILLTSFPNLTAVITVFVEKDIILPKKDTMLFLLPPTHPHNSLIADRVTSDICNVPPVRSHARKSLPAQPLGVTTRLIRGDRDLNKCL